MGRIEGDSEAAGRLTIAVLTYKRNADLTAVLPQLLDQIAYVRDEVAEARVLVIDNDPEGGARPIAEAHADRLVVYVHEPEPGISAARNRALAENLHVDLLVFIDDDERPTGAWLANLLDTYRSSGRPAAVIGPVISRFEVTPDPWVTAGDFFRRRRMPTGTELAVGATNNLLLDLDQVRSLGLTFDAGSGTTGGEDTLFTKEIVAKGGRMVWCDEAIVHDVVPAARLTRAWLLGRAVSSGNSWSVTSVRVQDGRAARVGVRLALTGRGLVRLVGGTGRFLTGVVTRSPRHQAKGLRTAARGVGMVSGAWGHRYEEYRRSD